MTPFDTPVEGMWPAFTGVPSDLKYPGKRMIDRSWLNKLSKGSAQCHHATVSPASFQERAQTRQPRQKHLDIHHRSPSYYSVGQVKIV